MKYIIDNQIGKPAYLQIYEQLKKDIVKGVYSLGAKLPSKRFLSEELGLSVITVEHAYALLTDEGYIEPRERSGYFVCYRQDDTFLSPEKPTKTFLPHSHIADLDNDFPFSVYAKTMRKVLSIYGDDIFAACPSSGCDELKTAIQKYLQRSRGISVNKTQIVIGAGSEYLYGLIVQMLGKNRIYALENPSYSKIGQVYRANGVKTLYLSLLADGISSEELKNTVASVLHITPYRSYPSRVSASASKKNEYIRWAEQEGRVIVEDDFESEFTLLKKAEETVYSMSGGKNVIYVNTFSKTISPSVRAAYMLLPEDMVETYQKTVGFYACSVPYFNQLVLAEFINGGDFERHINRVRRKRRQQIIK
ncbi:MAG: PLP-dependent aminotransferase family protein [Acutalibacteraceae bacterium]